ncbi:MAG: hypothetical protein KA296_11035 [Marinobacter sp.]|nr:hypothetical protein [Marinobacter sp.]
MINHVPASQVPRIINAIAGGWVADAAIHGVGGERGIPLSWLARVTDASAILRNIESLVNRTCAPKAHDVVTR